MNLKKMTVALLLLTAFFLTSVQVHGAVGDMVMWPVATDVKFSSNGNTQTITYTIDMIPMVQTNTRNTLNNYLVLMTSGAGRVGYKSSADLLPPQSYKLTWKEASDQWMAKYGMHTVLVSTVNSATSYSGGCGGLVLFGENLNSPTNTWGGKTDSPVGIYSCTNIPRADYRCEITPSSLDIDYGRVNATAANGKVASVNFNINCTGAVTASFTSTSGETLVLASGLTAKLLIDNKALNTNFNFATGNTAHTLSATLSAGNVNAGVYNASTALIINYQ